jgi:hypothetical protein
MKKCIIFLFSILPLFCQAAQESFVLSNKIHSNDAKPFIQHKGAGRFGSYLTMTINYPPVRALFKQLAEGETKLKTRGEAHITVVTPLTFYDVLSKKISIEQINKIALKQKIQSADFEVVCLGRGQATIKDKLESAYFVVVKSKALLSIRRDIQASYVKQGGQAGDFAPEHFYPHITLGFTARDLHISDGVIKDRRACIASLKQQVNER